ncbi:MAG TPA: nucleotidyltransferase family protein [Longimicrobium sp.]|jgi:predicted nucleotidyltransferase
MEPKPLSRDRVIHLLREHRAEMDRFGVLSISLFGSVARDEATETSDVDVLVDFGPEPTFRGYMDLKFFLEDLFGTRVDVVTPGTLRPRVEQSVTGDLLRVA